MWVVTDIEGIVLNRALNGPITYLHFLQETVFSLIDVLSAMKINQLQLYMQNTFSFAGHETVWRNKTPYSTRFVSIRSLFHLLA